MRLSVKYPVPREFALFYEFVNSLDLRRFVEHGAAHIPHDALATIAQLEHWMRTRHLLEPGARLTATEHRQALELRDALRTFLSIPPADRLRHSEVAMRLNPLSEAYPLVLTIGVGDAVSLQPAQGSTGLARVLAELHWLATTGQLDRVKTCESDECRWIFYDWSKPASRRWCSSTLCGNRQKTRAYRQRRRNDSGQPPAS